MTAWKIVSNIELKQVSYGSPNHIWALDPDGIIYQFSNENWIIVPGPVINSEEKKFKWISVGDDGLVWGIVDAPNQSEDDYIFRRDGVSWTKINGFLSQISVGCAGKVWGVTKNDEIYRRDGTIWTKIAGSLRCVSVGGDGTVWGTVPRPNQPGKYDIYKRDGNSWTKIGGSLSQISVGSSTNIWGVTPNHQIFKYSSNESPPWIEISGDLKQISVGSDGEVYGVENNQVFNYIKDYLLLISEPKLEEDQLEPTDDAFYSFNVINVSNSVIAKDIKLEFKYDDTFSDKGVTFDIPDDNILNIGDLQPTESRKVEIQIITNNAEVGTYMFNGIDAYYDIEPLSTPESLPVKSNKDGYLHFNVVHD